MEEGGRLESSKTECQGLSRESRRSVSVEVWRQRSTATVSPRTGVLAPECNGCTVQRVRACDSCIAPTRLAPSVGPPGTPNTAAYIGTCVGYL